MKLSCLVTAASVLLSAKTLVAESAITGNVLVWVDAPLYLDPSTTAPSIRLASLDHGRDQDVGHVVPMRVVAAKGDFVEVEPTAGIECGWWRLVKPAALQSMRLFVQRSDLSPVVTKPFSAAFEDGSRITLQPGVAVAEGKVSFHGAAAPVTISAAHIGLSYRPHAIAPVPKPGKSTALLDEKTDVTLGDGTFVLGPWVAGSATRRGDRMLVPIATRCMSATVSAPTDRVHKNVSLGGGVAEAVPAARPVKLGGDRYYLAAGTKVTSETGEHVVGALATELDVKKPSSGRACGDVVVEREEVILDAPHIPDAGRPVRTLRLCAPAAAVVVEKR